MNRQGNDKKDNRKKYNEMCTREQNKEKKNHLFI